MSKIATCLWFDHEAEEAMEFYLTVFPNARRGTVSRYGPGAPLPEGTAMMCTFTLEGYDIMALNGGPVYRLNPAVSLYVDCTDQAEVDRYWDALVAGGEPSRCGWLVDRFGLSWQIVPRVLGELLGQPDPVKAERVMQAMLAMDKIDVAGLERASRGA